MRAATNSPFTAALLAHIATPGLQARQVLSRVRQAVHRETDGRQVPWDSSSLMGDFYFNVEINIIAAPSAEIVYWDSIKASGDAADYRAYLDRFGADGLFADLAERRLAALDTPAATVASGEDADAALPLPATPPPASPGPAPGEVIKDCSVCPEHVVVPAGRFRMGSSPGKPGHEADEGPPLDVAIPRPFAIGRYEVTRADYRRFVEATGHQGQAGCWV